MCIDEIEGICRLRALPFNKDFPGDLSEKELFDGYIKFNIQDEDDPDSLNGEGVWGWLAPEDKVKYDDDNFEGELTAILCNTPFNYCGILWPGSEVRIHCHGSSRPTLSKEWVLEKILNTDWYQERQSERQSVQ